LLIISIAQFRNGIASGFASVARMPMLISTIFASMSVECVLSVKNPVMTEPIIPPTTIKNPPDAREAERDFMFAMLVTEENANAFVEWIVE
jgi:hypothetical protein